MSKRQRRRQRGTSIIEFAIVSIVLIPMVFGVVAFGVNLGHTTQVIQISRDAGHLYANGVDFSQSSNQDIVVNIASPMGMTSRTAGRGVVILTRVQQVYTSDCSAAGLSGSACSNSGKDVITNRIVIGNSSAFNSNFGTPSSSMLDSQGNVRAGTSSANGYLNDPTAVATGMASMLSNAGMTPSQGQSIYVSEAYFNTPDVSYLGGPASGGVYAKTLF